MSVLRSIRFPDETFAYLEALAEKHGHNVNQVVVNLVNLAHAATMPKLPEAEVGRVMRGLSAKQKQAAFHAVPTPTAPISSANRKPIGFDRSGAPIYR